MRKHMVLVIFLLVCLSSSAISQLPFTTAISIMLYNPVSQGYQYDVVIGNNQTMACYLSDAFLYSQKFTQFLPGNLKSISFYAGTASHVRIALYSDGGSNPLNPLTSVYTVSASAGLNTVAMSQEDQISLNATSYWIVFDFDTDGGVCFSSTRYQTYGSSSAEYLIRNFISDWTYGSVFPSTWSGGTCDNCYEAEVYWTVATTGSVPTQSYFNTPKLQAEDSYIKWYASDYVWNNVLNVTTRDLVRQYMNVFAQKAFQYMGFDFTGNHFLVNYANPLGNKIAVWIQDEVGIGGYVSSGHDGYRPSWAQEDTPLIGIGTLCFIYVYGSAVLLHGENIYGYYAYDFVSHEFLNMFNFFSCVNVPSWIADGHSPYAYTISKIVMNQTGVAMGGTLGMALMDLADREINYGLSSDTGVQLYYTLQNYFPNAVSDVFKSFREEKMAFGWVENENATVNYPIVTNTSLRSAYFEVYYNLAANVTDLPWNHIEYIPTNENDPSLRDTLVNILVRLRSTDKMLRDYENDGHDITSLNATMQTAWDSWRKGYYVAANTTMFSVYTQLIGLGYQPLHQPQTCLKIFPTVKDTYDFFFSNASTQINYSKYLEDYNILLYEYANLGDNYCSLQTKYDDLNENYDALQTKYTIFNQSYNPLLMNYSALQTKYTNLSYSYNSLLANYSILQNTANSLSSNFSNLLTEIQSSENELNSVRNLNYILIVTMVVFVIITTYLVGRLKAFQKPRF